MTLASRLSAFAALALAACSPGGESDAPRIDSALASIRADDIMAHTRVLASDAYEGRAPGTPGEDSTVAYLEAQFKRLGLKPGNPDGSYVQNVSMIGFTAKPSASFTVAGKTIALNFPDDYVAVSRHEKPQIDVVNSDVIFVGYGVVAPEYGWDDYKGVDMKGKTIVMLVNDPAVPDRTDSTRLDSAMFKGRAMTYYGRWTYKYEIASTRGAAAAIIIHETEPAGYPYAVVQGSWGRENIDIRREGPNDRVAVEAWMTAEKARELLAASGHDLDALKRAARAKDFTPVALSAKATFRIANTVRTIQSRNVIAKLEGATAPNEFLIYSAHWDHLGRDSSIAGDQIFNGALDNASGTAALLEIAEAYTKLSAAPRRSVLFLAVTAEESGLLGAKYYGQSPLYPLDRTAANINIDGVNQWGRTKDVTVIGLGNSTLDDDLTAVLTAKGRIITPDPETEKGYYYRSDHFEFAKQGVPALYVGDSGIDYIGKPPEYATQKRDAYTANDYHKPSDEIKPDWDLSGAVEDVKVLFEVGMRVAQSDQWPSWKPGTEFKAKRDSMMAPRK